MNDTLKVLQLGYEDQRLKSRTTWLQGWLCPPLPAPYHQREKTEEGQMNSNLEKGSDIGDVFNQNFFYLDIIGGSHVVLRNNTDMPRTFYATFP